MHVGIVSFGSPPLPHVSAKRPSYMGRGLVDLKHEVTILTCDWRTAPSSPSLIEDGVRYERVSPRDWYPGFDPQRVPIQIEKPKSKWRTRFDVAKRTARWGAFEPWGREALRRLLEVHRENPLDVVWAIHGDDTSHEIAYRFHRSTGCPWVADFKDPWNVFHGRSLLPAQKLATRRRLRSSRVLTETSSLQAVSDAETFGYVSHFLPSGYNAEKMAAAAPESVSDGPSIVFTGHLASGVQAFDALREFLARLDGDLVAFTLHVFGKSHTNIEAVARAAGFTDRLHTHPFVSEDRAFGLMKGADALVMLPMTSDSARNLIGMKELEYLASGSPVFYLDNPAPEIAALSSSLPNLLVVRTADEQQAALTEILSARAEARPAKFRGEVNAAALAQFTWERLVLQLETILKAKVHR